MKVAFILLEIIVCLRLPFSLQEQELVSKRWRYETTTISTTLQVTRTEESRQTGNEEQMRISKIKSTDITTQSGVETTNYPDINDDFCFSVGVCHQPATKSYSDWYCNYDTDCETYKDCCLQHNLTIATDHHVYECINLDTEQTAYRGFQAISRCPLGYGNK
ncbi:unnamed protein product [Mytilus edulis]|uniref:WAP domain-containing protein n=1 Tax=Mytilus edulis TaxID=6550 RepID=A0A8S3QAK1_MYTED|nr:unnamed protein product [Mytilus edulis]